MKLNSTLVERAKPEVNKETNRFKKRTKLFDGNGLYLYITPKGGKSWYKEFKFAGKANHKFLGTYPALKLSDARLKSADIDLTLSQGINPNVRLISAKNKALSLRQLFEEFSEFKTNPKQAQRKKWEPSTIKKHIERFDNYVFPYLADMEINRISSEDLTEVLLKVQDHGTLENMRKIRSVFNVMFDYAVSRSYITTNIALLVPKSSFITAEAQNYKHVTTPYELKEVIEQLNNSERGTYIVHQALQVGIRVFLRPGVLASIKWSYVNFQRNLITIPAEVMKSSKEHLVPMSSQVKQILMEVHNLTGSGEYVFASPVKRGKHIGIGALESNLKRNDIWEITPHGFRHTASTILNERHHDEEAVELQLSHSIGGIRGVYNKAKKLNARIALMQDWSDFIDRVQVVDEEKLVRFDI